MLIKESEIKGVYIAVPNVYRDVRGSFLESFRVDVWERVIGPVQFIQENESFSTQHVLRGLHYQVPPFGQSKLVRTVVGAVLDVVVDMRPESSTFGQCHIEVLDDKEKKQLFVPNRFAHGFLILSPEAVVQYKVDAPYHPAYERTLRFDDPYLQINWGLASHLCVLSEKDRVGLFWEEAVKELRTMNRAAGELMSRQANNYEY